MREACTKYIYEAAKGNRNVLALTADSRNAWYERIRDELPTQYIDYGIAEQNMIASAAGLAAMGKIPFIFAASNFLAMRGFEFIRNDVCLGNKNVKLIGVFSGLTRPAWGTTHQGTEELALLRCLPNLLVISPCSPIEAREATRYAYEHDGPVYIRIEASNEPEHFEEGFRFEPGRANVLREGCDITIFSMGEIINEALEAAEHAQEKGVSVRVVEMPTLKPIDKACILDAAKQGRGIITLEEHSRYGGLGSAVAEVLAEYQAAVPLRILGLDGCAKGCGGRDYLRNTNKIGLEDCACAIDEIFSLAETSK